MRNKTWNFMDKSEWPRGEWDNEPDKLQWLDADTGLPCLIVRNHSGALCGYVGVADGHALFGRNYNELDIDVHGSLTFAALCQEDKEHGICHIVEEGENERVWWLGFDCAHFNDRIPGNEWRSGFGDEQASYRNVEYVKAECHSLAAQLKGIQNATL